LGNTNKDKKRVVYTCFAGLTTLCHDPLTEKNARYPQMYRKLYGLSGGKYIQEKKMFGNDPLTQLPPIVHPRNLPVCTEETPGYIPAFKGLCMIAIESPEKSLYQ